MHDEEIRYCKLSILAVVSHKQHCAHSPQMDDAGKLSKEHALDLVKAMTKDDAEKEAAATAIVDKCEETEVSEDQ